MLKKHLEAFLEIAPYLGELINEDISIGAMNEEEFILSQPGKTLSSGQPSGAPHKFDEFTRGILKNKKPVTLINPSAHFKVPVEVTMSPVLEEDGSEPNTMVAIVKNISNRMKLSEAAKTISDSFEQTNKAVEEIAADSQKLSTDISEIVKYAAETQKKINEIDSVIQVIKNISSQSNLLALNATIEAARAGETGKGFSVVASEIGKLAKLSKESAEKVNISLTDMKNAIDTISNKIEKIGAYSENQAASTEEISATVNEVYITFKNLTEIA